MPSSSSLNSPQLLVDCSTAAYLHLHGHFRSRLDSIRLAFAFAFTFITHDSGVTLASHRFALYDHQDRDCSRLA